MTRNEFIARFSLTSLLSPSGDIDSSEYLNAAELNSSLKSSSAGNVIQYRTAAVLIPIGLTSSGELNIVLTKRAEHLRHHPGQIAFPGGKVEETDNSLIETALRETEEEIGISPDNISIIGCLPAFKTISGFRVTPVIGFIEQKQAYRLDTNEVSDIIEVPLTHFTKQQVFFQQLESYHRGIKRSVYVIPYKQHTIWGITAAILNDLAAQLTANN